MRRVLAFAAATLLSGAVAAQNLATVNGRPITKEKEAAWVAFAVQQGQKDSPQLRETIKKELIRREVFLQEAEKRGIPAKPDVKFQIDLQRQNVIVQALIREEALKAPVTVADVDAEYQKQKLKAGDKEYHARHILVETEAEAKAIIAKLKAGEKFEELAKQSKDPGSAPRGGDLDWAGPDAFVPAFSAAMIKLKKGEFTETPVQTNFGWHVIRLDDVRATQFPPLAQVQGQIKEGLQQQKVQAFLEALEKKAVIK